MSAALANSILNQYEPESLPKAELQTLLSDAKKAAKAAGKAILEIYYSGDFNTIAKADTSPLTLADEAAHQIIISQLAATGLPILSEEGAQIPYEIRQHWTWFWLIDPLDGTKEFISRNGEFTVNIALMHRQEPVAGVVLAPVPDTMYVGAKALGVYQETNHHQISLQPLPEPYDFAALRQKQNLNIVASRSHLSPETEAFIGQFRQPQLQTMGSSLKLMLLAENKADVYPRFGPTMDWDLAAGDAILRALNKAIFQPDLQTKLLYNQPDLRQPAFVAF